MKFINDNLQIILFSILFFIISNAICLLYPQAPLADIYTYKDKNGVKHFTNVPNSSKYKLFIPERTGRIYYNGGSGYLRASTRAINSKAFDPIIEKASVRYGLDCALIKAVISAESAFNSQAVSPKGAKGLMQIMPSNYSSLNISDPFHPYQNIMGGTKYLKQMLEVNNGKLQLALAAYNAGPEAVRKYEGIPPYNETRNYVSKVISLYNQYKTML
ncbi:MAG: lytic transglycosylase domain-containing protein [Desulfamplus sp.]|nr:lytic transglycosylase domain-containing protein [Desulfamplus sp.]MBF0413607.1 lytic transglycosylase domain-containing protein [Desulfamplus sp.]